jgi:hypothetical protein
MAYLKYYADENRRHHIAESIKLSFTACAALTAWLCKHFNLETNKVTLLDRKTKRFSRVSKTKSWFSSGTNEIVYHPSMLNPLTVAHEVAHYAHNEDRKRRYKEAKEKHDQRLKQEEARYQQESATYSELVKKLSPLEAERLPTPQRPRYSYFRFPKEKWHGPEHRIFVERAVTALKTLPALQRYFAETPEAALAREELKLQAVLRDGLDPVAVPRNDGDLVQKFFETLPEKLTCPCCKFHGHKMNFGVRVIERDASGVPVKMRAQSYCKSCR